MNSPLSDVFFVRYRSITIVVRSPNYFRRLLLTWCVYFVCTSTLAWRQQIAKISVGKIFSLSQSRIETVNVSIKAPEIRPALLILNLNARKYRVPNEGVLKGRSGSVRTEGRRFFSHSILLYKGLDDIECRPGVNNR